MIFLGAGASKVLGLKTMQDLTSLIIEKMNSKGYGGTIDDILRSLKNFGLTPDFENIYTTLEALANPKEGIKKSGAFTAYIASKGDFERTKTNPDYEEILLDFRKLIYCECSIPKGVIESKKGIFDKLFNSTRDALEYRRFTTKMGVTGEHPVDIGKSVVTTNYDMSIELYHRLTRTPLADGFRPTENEYTKELAFNWYPRFDQSRWLVKLHGSIWQFKQEDKIIQTIGPPDSLPLEISVGEQMMIYPVGEKPILHEPFFSFYSIFKEQPWNVLIVIGYSFRDDPVNTVILQRLTETMSTASPAKLIVVNPHAEDVIKNMGPMVTKLDQRIFRISESFEDDDALFNKIRSAIPSKNWDDYKRNILHQMY